ncbi:MAG: Na(+)/H(+) antiporter subunit D [Pseudomonadota bacterium]
MSALLHNPAVILTIGALIAARIPSAVRKPFMIVVLAVSALTLFRLGLGDYGQITLFGETLTTLRIDPLSRIFAIVFHIAAFLNVLYSWHDAENRTGGFAGLAYPATCLGGVLSGDFLTLFVWWEIAAITSVFYIWMRGTRETYLAGMRYLAIQILSGVLLLGGIALYYRATGSLAFDAVGLRDGAGNVKLYGLLLFLAFGIKSAFPLLHNWVQDAYPKSTLTGTIILSVFTTKLAVYSLARGFAGTTELVYIGAIMTIFPIFFALIENDLRKVLCYSINNQVGFMVIGIGIGSAMSVNGAVGYAFCNIIFESLLFMALGAAMYRTGTSKATELGGLYRDMPWTMVLCVIGALSISAFPFTAGFVTKGLIIEGAAAAHLPGIFVIWLVLLFASAGVLEHAGIKIPYFTFFAHSHPNRTFKNDRVPVGMMAAMVVSAILSIGIGLVPGPLYALMPFQDQITTYNPNTPYHFIEQLQLLLFAVLAFAVLIKMKWYPAEVPSDNLDSDWLVRVPGRAVLRWANAATGAVWMSLWGLFAGRVGKITTNIYRLHGPEGRLARAWPVGFMAMWTGIVLFAVLVLSFIG